MVKVLQIARASAFYSQLVWSPVESVSKADFTKYKIVQLFETVFAGEAGHLPVNCMVHVILLFYVNNCRV